MAELFLCVFRTFLYILRFRKFKMRLLPTSFLRSNDKIYWVNFFGFVFFASTHLGPKEFQYRGKNYFLSSHVPGLAGKKVDWLDGRNLCREYCMDLIELQTQEKNNLIFRLIQTNDVPYIWTAGRLCDFKGCEGRQDLEPKNLNGWFWSASRAKM